MHLYRVVGLRKYQQTGSSYETEPNGRICLDETGTPRSISRGFDYYVLFVRDIQTHIYYSIRMFEIDLASFARRAYLCRMAYMEITEIDKRDISRWLTHVPMRDLSFETKEPIQNYHFENDLDLDVYEYMTETPEKEWIFLFSTSGGSESRETRSCGYVEVNMDPFCEATATQVIVDHSCCRGTYG